MRNLTVDLSAAVVIRVNHSGVDVYLSQTPVYLELVTCGIEKVLEYSSEQPIELQYSLQDD